MSVPMVGGDGHEVVRAHLQRFFANHACTEHIWHLGPGHRQFPDLRVVEFAPGPRSGLWSYATVGGWAVRDDSPLEFVLLAAEPSLRHVELLFMAVRYHWSETLGLGHTLPIGEPWLPGSSCAYLLVSLPYPYGPELEICNLGDQPIHILWLLPITAAEREYKIQAGQEALELCFDESAIEFWDPERKSVK